MRVLLLLLLVLGSCFEDSAVIYKISSGDHYSTPKIIQTVKSNPFIFYVTFNESALYAGGDDINKLYGFSDCNSTIHNNSARFGWRGNKGKVEIFSYVYCSGKRSFTYITDIPVNTKIRYTISMNNSYYIFSVNGISVNEKRCNNCNIGVYTISQPYFGGNIPAPHNIYIKIE
jgi:hypothetical protein